MAKFARVNKFTQTEIFLTWLDNELTKRSWNRAYLAERASISQSTLSMIGKRERNPGPDLCLSIAKALDIPPEIVFRKAGLLPQVPDNQENLEEFREILNHLTPEETEELKRIGWLKIDLKRQSEIRKRNQQHKEE